MTESERSRLIQLAAEMVNGKDMPLEFASDWNLPASTSARVRRDIEASSRIARSMCREWSKRIMAIVDGKDA